MLTDENVKIAPADGSECLVCDKKIEKVEPCMVQISFKLLISVKKGAHLECARVLKDLIDLRIHQAVNGTGTPV